MEVALAEHAKEGAPLENWVLMQMSLKVCQNELADDGDS